MDWDIASDQPRIKTDTAVSDMGAGERQERLA